jgi:hypothetical protein
MQDDRTYLPLILPPGTQIVSRVAVRVEGRSAPEPAGAVGVVTRSPVDADHAYRVRFRRRRRGCAAST